MNLSPLHNVFPLNETESVKVVPDFIRYKGAIYARLAIAEYDSNTPSSTIGEDVRNSNEFIPKGMAWKIRFNGEDVGGLIGGGMVYIHKLLSHPYEQFNYHELRGANSGAQNESSIDKSLYVSGSEDQIGTINRTVGKSVEVGDEKTKIFIERILKRLWEKKKTLEKKKAELIEDADMDVPAITKLENDIDKIEMEIQNTLKFMPQYRSGNKIKDKNEKDLHSAVQMAIDRSIKVIAQFNPGLAKHLKKNIKRENGTIEYRPAPGGQWVTT